MFFFFMRRESFRDLLILRRHRPISNETRLLPSDKVKGKLGICGYQYRIKSGEEISTFILRSVRREGGNAGGSLLTFGSSCEFSNCQELDRLVSHFV
jgi:hypothetical protein